MAARGNQRTTADVTNLVDDAMEPMDDAKIVVKDEVGPTDSTVITANAKPMEPLSDDSTDDAEAPAPLTVEEKITKSKDGRIVTAYIKASN